jgi:hypothetical protein
MPPSSSSSSRAWAVVVLVHAASRGIIQLASEWNSLLRLPNAPLNIFIGIGTRPDKWCDSLAGMTTAVPQVYYVGHWKAVHKETVKFPDEGTRHEIYTCSGFVRCRSFGDFGTNQTLPHDAASCLYVVVLHKVCGCLYETQSLRHLHEHNYNVVYMARRGGILVFTMLVF